MRSLIFLSTVPFMIHGMQQPAEQKRQRVRSLFDLAYAVVSARPSQATTLVAQNEYWRYILRVAVQKRFACDKDYQALDTAIQTFSLSPTMAREKEVKAIQGFQRKQGLGNVRRFVQAIDTINASSPDHQSNIWRAINEQS